MHRHAPRVRVRPRSARASRARAVRSARRIPPLVRIDHRARADVRSRLITRRHADTPCAGSAVAHSSTVHMRTAARVERFSGIVSLRRTASSGSETFHDVSKRNPIRFPCFTQTFTRQPDCADPPAPPACLSGRQPRRRTNRLGLSHGRRPASNSATISEARSFTFPLSLSVVLFLCAHVAALSESLGRAAPRDASRDGIGGTSGNGTFLTTPSRHGVLYGSG